jgi:LysM repeat protein
MAVPFNKRRQFPWIPLIILATGVAFLLPFVTVISYFGYLQIFEHIVPGVRVGDLDLTWKNISQAAAEINTLWNLERKITVTDGLHTWQLYPYELGLNVDGYQTAQKAYEVGRFQTIEVEINQILTSMLEGWQVDLEVNLDPEIAQASLERLNAQARKPPQNARVVLQGGILTALPGELGYAVNVDKTMNNLVDNPAAVLASSVLRLELKPVPPAIGDVATVLDEAEKLLNVPLTIAAYDPITDETVKIPVSREVLASWFTVGTEGSDNNFKVDPSQVVTYLLTLGDSLGAGRFVEAEKYGIQAAQAIEQGKAPFFIISHHPTTYSVKKGDTLLKISWKLGFPMWKLIEANQSIDPNQLVAGQVLNVPSKDEMLPLPVIHNKRIVINMSKQRLLVYQDGKQIHNYVISTGIDRSPTQPGVFQVLEHKPNAYASVWDLTMPNFLGIYEAWPGFMNGIHGLPMLSNGTRLWANILGKPASFGCIILDLPASKELYQWAENGVVVEIKP